MKIEDVKTRQEAIDYLRANGFEKFALFLEEPDTKEFAAAKKETYRKLGWKENVCI